jgi:4-amino-4-deoxy-L-arabinose transferase-like glycosyltransferase
MKLDGRTQIITVGALVIIAVARIVSTYSVFNATDDESTHIAAGMEWIQEGTFHYQAEHPPLSRVPLAIGPYWIGRRVLVAQGVTVLLAGNILLHKDGDYWTNLTAARIGVLPFFILATVVVFLWAKRWFSARAALWAVLLFTFLPPILAHAGLATIDMACTASVGFALYQLLRWMEEPSPLHSVFLGAAAAFAVLCKFSSVPFLGLCFGGALLYALVLKSPQLHVSLTGLALMVAAAYVVLWAGYRFTWNPLGELLTSVSHVVEHGTRGNEAYLLGRYSTSGWWYFFPVALAVKTPIAFLLFSAAGVFLALPQPQWQRRLTVIFPAAILVVGMATRINIGVRHVLPVYLFLAILAGHAIATFLENGLRPVAFASMLLVAWMLIDSARTHPDYLAYFNETAGAHPEKILVDSDLDWGQDLHRLSLRLRELHVNEVNLAYFGAEPLALAGLPFSRPLDPITPPHGYVAISLQNLMRENAKDGSYAYLKTLTPKERIGRSIDLFYLP